MPTNDELVQTFRELGGNGDLNRAARSPGELELTSAVGHESCPLLNVLVAHVLAACAWSTTPDDPPTGGDRHGRPPATRWRRPSGAGHLAWHFVRTCGRYTPSATFDLVDLDVNEDSTDIAA
jgi:hypothetical protein